MEENRHCLYRAGDWTTEVRSGSRGRDPPSPSPSWKSGDGGPVRLAWRRIAVAFTVLEIGGVEGDRSDKDRRENGCRRSEGRRERGKRERGGVEEKRERDRIFENCSRMSDEEEEKAPCREKESYEIEETKNSSNIFKSPGVILMREVAQMGQWDKYHSRRELALQNVQL
ncbi:hypothetical protein TIFTF001_003966 [Ficus carica]|uniref:Uncharacterized protein n=1 Tax=Ficus carica TaxID=3494 RepID=A0AA88CWF5_FICCA|nr:hypothetical protein TIFTF001_003966 [Ficus carica]